MLCELEHFTATELKNRLVHDYGMLIRDCSNFFGLTNHFFRVSTQKPEENDALVAAIREILKGQ
jgi:threonine-phosphate decarboxylase